MPVYIDVVGRCNLKCPSCPMGNSFDKDSVGGSMSPELLTRILEKADQNASWQARWNRPFRGRSS